MSIGHKTTLVIKSAARAQTADKPEKVRHWLRHVYLFAFCGLTACTMVDLSNPNASREYDAGSESLGSTTFDDQIALGSEEQSPSSELPQRIGSQRTLPVQGPPVMFGWEGGRVGP